MRKEQPMLAPQIPETLRGSTHTTCCIVGAGPAGAVLALLLARQGIEVTLLESHGDFDRQFRGDTIYPTVLEIMDELGLAERLHTIPHTKMERIPIETPQGAFVPINMRSIKSPYPYIMLVPQADFLEFVTAEASRYPNFHLVMNAAVRELLEEGGRIRGVRYRAPDGWYEVHAGLTVGADGRFSKVRSLARIPLHTTPQDIDTIWFRLPRHPHDPEESFARMTASKVVVGMLIRTDHWQVFQIIPKGTYAHMRTQGLPAFRKTIASVMPFLEERLEQIAEWNQLSLLSVESGRVSRWYRQGLLLIGDAAHVMSPAFGVGVNVAIQDAVVAANVLTHPLLRRQKQGLLLTLRPLKEVQLRRQMPIYVLQQLQHMQGPNVDLSFLKKLPGFHSLQKRSSALATRVITRLSALGPWRIHVRYRQVQADTVAENASTAVTDERKEGK